MSIKLSIPAAIACLMVAPNIATLAQVSEVQSDICPAQFHLETWTVHPLLLPITRSLTTPQLVSTFPDGRPITGLYRVIGINDGNPRCTENSGQFGHLVYASSEAVVHDGANSVSVELAWSSEARSGFALIFPLEGQRPLPAIASLGTGEIRVGAKIHVPANIPPGVYNGEFEIIVGVE